MVTDYESPSSTQLNPLPIFQSAEGWLPYTDLGWNSMDEHWKAIPTSAGTMDIKGCNYYVFPSPHSGETHSAHFDPASPFFQAFFGIYVVSPLPSGPVPLDAVPILGERDNSGWIRLMGGGERRSELLSNTIECLEKMDGKCIKWKFTTRYSMPLDVGPCNPGNPEPDCPRVKTSWTIPPLWKPPRHIWEPHVEGYDAAIQSPVIQYVWYENDYLFVNFLIGSEYRDRSGNTISTWKNGNLLAGCLHSMAVSMRIAFRKGPFGCNPGF